MEYDTFFDFTSCSFDGHTRTATFVYTTKLKKQPLSVFTETLRFSKPFPQDASGSGVLLSNMLTNLHLILGISYWKMYCLKNVTIDTVDLTTEQAKFWNTVYRKGLGEFFYTNKIDFRNLNIFQGIPGTGAPKSIRANGVPRRALVGVGGGKDSAVAIELLRQKRMPATAFYVETEGRHGAEEEVVTAAGIDCIRIERKLDPQLYQLSRTGQVPSGHVPVSALYAFTGMLTALLYGYSHVVTGNERSADFGNVVYLGEEVNHQWSKSSEFERMFQDYFNSFVSPSFTYTSALRAYSELAIVQMFSEYPQYFSVFSSCNRVSSKNGKSSARWCGECPKCAFVFTCLSAFLPKAELVSMFGHNLYADSELVPLFRELLGLKGFKPFECVGTPEEMKVAMHMAHERGEFGDSIIMKLFADEVIDRGHDFEEMKRRVFEKENFSSLR